MISTDYTLGIDIGSTTVKIAVLDPAHSLMFADYRRHHADIRKTLYDLLAEAQELIKIPAELSESWTKFTKSPQVIENTRVKIDKLIQRLQ